MAMRETELSDAELLERLTGVADALDQVDALLGERLELWALARERKIPEGDVAAASRTSRSNVRAMLSRHGYKKRTYPKLGN